MAGLRVGSAGQDRQSFGKGLCRFARLADCDNREGVAPRLCTGSKHVKTADHKEPAFAGLQRGIGVQNNLGSNPGGIA